MKKPSKTAAELEAMIRLEMEALSEWPTGMMVSVQPHGDSWRAWTIPQTAAAAKCLKAQRDGGVFRTLAKN